MRRWAAAGLEITHRTSAAIGEPATARRNGYDVVRRGSRYTVFPRAIAGEITRTMGRYDAVVEIWNGVPWFSPVWRRTPGITFLHHVHGPMWDQILPGPLASFGRALEARLAPPFYRRGLTATPSDATREELLELGFHADRVTAIPNGTDPMFSPGGHKTAEPVDRRGRAPRAGEAIRAADRLGRHRPPCRARPHADDRRGGAGRRRTARSGGPTRRRRLDPLRRAGRPRRSRRAVPERMDRGQWLAGGGLGPESHGGRGLWDTGGGHRHPRPSQQCRRRRHRHARSHRTSSGRKWPRVLLDDALRLRLGQAALERARTLTWDASALGIIRVLHRAVTVTVGNDSRQ